MAAGTLVMDQRIVWDRGHKKQVEEAKAMFLSFKRRGHKILNAAGKLVQFFRPELEEVIIKAERTGGHTMMVLCDKGDDRIVWDKENGQEAKEAKAKFLELIGKGYKAYSVDNLDRKNRPIEEFDVDAEQILMVPPTAKG